LPWAFEFGPFGAIFLPARRLADFLSARRLKDILDVAIFGTYDFGTRSLHSRHTLFVRQWHTGMLFARLDYSTIKHGAKKSPGAATPSAVSASAKEA
jgi:hypothetical protein